MSKFKLVQDFVNIIFEANSDGEWNLKWKKHIQPEDGNFLGLSIELHDGSDQNPIDCGSLCDLMDILFHVQRRSSSFHVTEVHQVVSGDIGLPTRVDLIFEVTA
jgi:hypothetical protein